MRRQLVAIFAWLAFVAASSACAQTYPNRPIRFVVSVAPGGTQDAVARMMANQMSGQIGQSIIVDNRGGATGIIGCDIVAKAAPDGYTLLYAATVFAILPSVVKQLPFNVSKDFAPITRIAVLEGALLLVHPSLPARSVRELIELAKARPLSYGSPGVGNSLHLITEMLNVSAGTHMLHVPYKGAGPALNALLGNEVQVMFIPPTVAVQYVKAGRLRALGYSGAKRLEAMPDVPTIAEAGLPGFGMDLGWHALFAPAKTPGGIINRLHAEVRRALEVTKLRDFLLAGGYEPKGEAPVEFQRIFEADIKRYAELARAAKIEPE
jgi:tripartite-type tricarboxylate transporter receptor subunit TctC